MEISFKNQTLTVNQWSPDHPYKRTAKYLEDSSGKFYSSLYPSGKNGLLFEKDGVYGLLNEKERQAFELTKEIYWKKYRDAKMGNQPK